MKYAELLSSYIEDSGLTLEHIAEVCKNKNKIDIHPTYISKLRKGSRPAPTEEVSKALAEACGHDPYQLIFTGYLEKTPSFILEKFIRYEGLFSAVKEYLLKLCNDEEFLANLSKKAGHRLTFEQLCDRFEHLPVSDQLGFIESAGVEIEAIKKGKDEISFILDFSKSLDNMHHLLIPEDAIPVSAQQQVVELPIYGEVRAGVGGYAVQNYLGTQTWMAKNGNCKGCYMLQIKGDSMAPRFLPGDYAVVRPQTDVDNGDVAIVIVDNEEGIIKRIKKYPNDIILKSDNSLYEDREFCGQDCERVKIIGKVIDIKAGRL